VACETLPVARVTLLHDDIGRWGVATLHVRLRLGGFDGLLLDWLDRPVLAWRRHDLSPQFLMQTMAAMILDPPPARLTARKVTVSGSNP
jgi:hypothetical protein